MREWNLHSVCEEAHCPNIGECWEDSTATFMILGDVCTRNCGYCAVTHGRPVWEDREEPERVGRAVARAGARARRHHLGQPRRPGRRRGRRTSRRPSGRSAAHAPGCRVELLIPDFQGARPRSRRSSRPRPDVLNHNTETVPRLYKVARHGGRYERVLELFRRARAAAPAPAHKSGIILGLGEEREELLATMRDLRDGRREHPHARPVPAAVGPAPAGRRYYHPDEFAELAEAGRALGFAHVESGPLVRSSYHAKKTEPRQCLARRSRRRAE